MTSRNQTPFDDSEEQEGGGGLGSGATQDKPRRGGRAGAAGGAAGGGAEEGLTADERERVVKGVVRLALFSVAGGRPFTRDDITKKVFGRLLSEAKAAQTRTLYNGVLEEARQRLQSVFGYDIVNLRDVARGGASTRGRGAAAAATAAMSQESQPLTGSSQTTGARRGGAAGGTTGTGAATGTSTYVLVNTMPGDLAVLDGPVCIPYNNSNNTNESDTGAQAAGAAGAATGNEEEEEETAVAALRGLLMVVLGLVVMSGGRVSEDALLAHLHMLGVERAFGLAQRRDIEGQLARFVQQQYLARQYTRRALPVGAAATGEGAGSVAEYVVGPRTLAEYSRVDVLRFVAAVLGQTLTQNMAEDVLVSQQDSASISAAFAEARPAAASSAASGDDNNDENDDDFMTRGPPAQRPRQDH